MKQVLPISILVFILIAQVSWGDIPETISYQGVLTDASGTPVADGSYSLTISIYDTETGVSALWSETHSPVTVKSGIFSVILGSSIPLTIDFDEQYWLGVTVAGSGPELIPRIPFTSSAYSLNARTVVDGAVTTVKLADDAVTGPKLADNVVSTTHILGGTIIGDDIANGVLVRSINLLKDDVTLAAGANVTITPSSNTLTISASGSGGSGWSLTGNAGTNPVTNFLGTTDNKALELRVNGLRVLRLEPDTTSPNLIGGHNGNWVTSGVYGATISGGGEAGYLNRVTDHYGTVSGGNNNQAGKDTDPAVNASFATVGGGMENKASAVAATVAGGAGNKANGYVATVGGGNTNTASDSYATVAGGYVNTASSFVAVVSGGYENTAGGQYATVGGGIGNEVTADHGTIGGGGMYDGYPDSGNRVTDVYGTVSGGGSNLAGNNVDPKNDASYATVGGGWGNTAGDHYATVGGGLGNQATAAYATIAGGGRSNPYDDTTANRVTDEYGTVGGGGNNQAGNNTDPDDDAAYATVGGGVSNVASSSYATVGGGGGNIASEDYATVSGGENNEAHARGATIAGGGNYLIGNRVTDEYGAIGGGGTNSAGNNNGDVTDAGYATVGGGQSNAASHKHATVGGGQNNTASDTFATVGGGAQNTASGYGAAIAGGVWNVAAGECSFATGRGAKANHDGCFVWSDGTSDVLTSFDNEFRALASGGFYFYTGVGEVAILAPGNGGAWDCCSDRTLKRNIRQVDSKEILAKLAQIPISQWSFKSHDPSIEHIGPMAQDFYAAFGLGRDDKHISTIDPDGVALAAIQGLYELVKEKDRQIAELEERVKALEALVK